MSDVGLNVDATPRGRQHRGRTTRPVPTQSMDRTSGRSRFQANAHSFSQHYLPRQGLFDKEEAITLLENIDVDYVDDSYGPEIPQTQEDRANAPPDPVLDSYDSSELELLSFYGSSEKRPQPMSQPVSWMCTPQSPPVTPVYSGSGRTRQTSYSTPRNQTLQPITINGQSQTDMISLLQEQQGMLQKVLRQQTKMEDQQKVLLEKQEKLEKKLNSLEEHTLSSGSDNHKQKTRVTRQLTNLVAEAYDALENHFLPNESSLSEHNQLVKSHLLKNIVSEKFSRDQVKHAVQRKYEQVRRQWSIDQKENCAEIIEAKAKQSRYRARRLRKYQNRRLVIKPTEEKYWSKVTPAYITEESDDSEDPSVIIEHKLVWRSNFLNTFMADLDKRYEAKVMKDGGAVMAKKARKPGAPSSSSCPSDAPKWAVDSGVSGQIH